MALVVGANAVARGWLSVSLDDERLVSMDRHRDLAGLLTAVGTAAVVAVDVPLAGDETTRRAVDEAVRAELGPRGQGHPLTPTFRLEARVQEAREAAAKAPHLVEVEPELSFQEMLRVRGSGDHLTHRKRSWAGIVERLRLLHAEGLRPARSFGGVGRSNPADVLDATAAAWTARRVAEGVARVVPAAPVEDAATGRRVAVHV